MRQVYSASYFFTQAELWSQVSGQGCRPHAREEPEAAATTAVLCPLPCSCLGGRLQASELRMFCVSGGCTFYTNFSLASQARWPWGLHTMDGLCRQLPTVQEEPSHLIKCSPSPASPLLSENKLAPCSFSHQEGASVDVPSPAGWTWRAGGPPNTWAIASLDGAVFLQDRLGFELEQLRETSQEIAGW